MRSYLTQYTCSYMSTIISAYLINVQGAFYKLFQFAIRFLILRGISLAFVNGKDTGYVGIRLLSVIERDIREVSFLSKQFLGSLKI